MNKAKVNFENLESITVPLHNTNKIDNTLRGFILVPFIKK